jgi:hypothetical protein
MCGRYAVFGSISTYELAKIIDFDQLDEHGGTFPATPR